MVKLLNKIKSWILRVTTTKYVAVAVHRCRSAPPPIKILVYSKKSNAKKLRYPEKNQFSNDCDKGGRRQQAGKTWGVSFFTQLFATIREGLIGHTCTQGCATEYNVLQYIAIYCIGLS